MQNKNIQKKQKKRKENANKQGNNNKWEIMKKVLEYFLRAKKIYVPYSHIADNTGK